jgi:hypothetical protein
MDRRSPAGLVVLTCGGLIAATLTTLSAFAEPEKAATSSAGPAAPHADAPRAPQLENAGVWEADPVPPLAQQAPNGTLVRT